VTATITLGSTGYYPGIAVTVIDTNNWFGVTYRNGAIDFNRCIAGTVTTTGGTATGVTARATLDLTVKVRADTIFAYSDGVLAGPTR
jgi:hypothetical protein